MLNIAHQDPIKDPEGVVYLCNIIIFVSSRNFSSFTVASMMEWMYPEKMVTI
jgi:hypothetical protein